MCWLVRIFFKSGGFGGTTYWWEVSLQNVQQLVKCWFSSEGHEIGIWRPDASLTINLTSLSLYFVISTWGEQPRWFSSHRHFQGLISTPKISVVFQPNFSIPRCMNIFYLSVSSQWRNSKFYAFILMIKRGEIFYHLDDQPMSTDFITCIYFCICKYISRLDFDP